MSKPRMTGEFEIVNPLGLHAREREGMLPIAPLLERDREQTV